MNLDLEGYLRRVGLERPAADAVGLANLQTAQISSIPFENIDPLLGMIPKLGIDAIAEKILGRRRGGYCFEMNGLFGEALNALGFDAGTILARVRNGAAVGGARTHLAFIVTIDGEEWLTDAGFGGLGPRAPIRLGTDEQQAVLGEHFRMIRDSETGEEVLQRLMGENWFSLYGFERHRITLADVETANLVCATWEKAPFPFHLMMTIGREGGRNNLLDKRVKYIRNGEIEERAIASIDELRRILADDFDLILQDGLVEKVWQRLSDLENVRAGF